MCSGDRRTDFGFRKKFCLSSQGCVLAGVTSLSEPQFPRLYMRYCSASSQGGWGTGWNRRGCAPCAMMQVLTPLCPPSAPSSVRPVYRSHPHWSCQCAMAGTHFSIPQHLLGTRSPAGYPALRGAQEKSPFPQEVHRLKPETTTKTVL